LRAHIILDEVRAGIPHPAWMVIAALRDLGETI